ncbi:MAG: polysaccharide biosynthesis/export family protein [Balneolaceae bacterium]
MTTILKLGSVFALAVIISGCSTSERLQEERASQQSTFDQTTTIQGDDYKIRSGDEIEILVWEQPNFNTETVVSGMGTIAIPLIGEIEVSGLTRDELERELTSRMSEYIRDEINLTISIRSTEQMMVSVFGMVDRPDNYPVVDETSIFKILSVAGGPTDQANIRRVKIYRKGGSPSYETIDLTYYLDSGQMDSVGMVRPGDVVYVPRRDNVVREMSEFLRDIVLLFGIFRVFN